MISFTRGPLLKEKPCCKFILKYDIKNYFENFIVSSENTTQTDLVMCNYV